MSTTTQDSGSRERIIKIVGKAFLVAGIVLNALVLLPAVAASAWTGHWTASAVLVVLSLLVWVGGLAGLKAWAAHRRSRRDEQVEEPA